MDLNKVVEQITARVTEKIAQMEKNAEIGESGSETINIKPKLLILSEDHGAACHELWENESLNHSFDIVCALSDENQCDVQPFDVVVIRNLSNASLGKITQGIGDTPFTELAIKAVLLGKKIIIPNEEIEIFKYRETAPKLYYEMMMQKLESLKNAGILFCNIEQLESVLLDNEYNWEKKNCCVTSGEQISSISEISSKGAITMDKRVITERDVQNAYEQHVNLICITEKTIITALAREYADQKCISFIIG